MIFLGLRVNQDVVKEDQNKIIQFLPKEICYKAIEGGWSICEAKGHDSKFIMAKSSVDSCFWDILFFDPDLVIS